MLNLFYGLQHGRRKLGLIGNIIAAIFILSVLFTATKNESAQSYTKGVINKLYGDEPPPGKYDFYTQETVDLSHLQKHELSEDFVYSRRIVNTRYVSGERKTLTTMDQSLIKQSTKASKKSLESVTQNQDLPLTLDVSVPKSYAGANSLSFGIATPIERLLDSLPQLMHWLPNTGAMLHVIAPTDPRTKAVTEHIRGLGINITIVESNDRFPINYFSLLPLLYHTRLPSTKWLAMIDDDTFFPDLGNLLAHFEERYNPKLPQLISGVSDDIVQIRKHGLMPFGGGGIFASVPFAASIVDNNYPGTAGAIKGGHFPTPPWSGYSPFGPSDEATATGASNYIMDPNSPYRQSNAIKSCLGTNKFEGDQILNDCVNKQTKVRPQYDIGLHQMDLKGDLSGFFESGRRSLTLHHWKTWFNVDIPEVAAVSKICGKECFLQRFRFKGLDAKRDEHPDELYVLNNGYSITKYPNGIKGLSNDIPEPPPPPPPPPPPELPDPIKDPITANPRFMRATGEWIEWPNLGIGEEVAYEGVIGVIIDKTMHDGGDQDKSRDPYKGFGNLMWVPMNQPFPIDKEKQNDEKPKEGEELKKDGVEEKKNEVDLKSKNVDAKPEDAKSEDTKPNPEDSKPKDTEMVSKDSSSKDESKDSTTKEAKKEAPAEVKATEETKPANNAKEEISHFHRIERALTSIPRKLMRRSPTDWIPIPGTSTTPTSPVVSEMIPGSNTSSAPPTSTSALEALRSEEDLEDERRFWESIEKTWWGGADRFEHALGPLRRPVKPEEEVIRYFMVESVGGWGDPRKQDTEDVKGALQPQGLIKGYAGDPDKKAEKIQHGGHLMAVGDAGFEGLWGPDPEPGKYDNVGKEENKEGEENKPAKRASPPVVGGGSVLAARSEKRWWTGGSSKSNLEGNGIGGINRPAVDWVRQTYIRKRWGNGEDEVLELVWVR